MKTIKSIYLDVCVLSRPFDDQSYLRIRLETEAVNLILSKVKNGEYTLAISPVHWEEIKAIAEIFERIDLQERLKTMGKPIKMDEEILVKKAVKALIGELGPIEANRFISMPRKKRIESVKRHREWQKQLDKNEFFNEIF